MKYEINLLPPRAIEHRMDVLQFKREQRLFSSFLLGCALVLGSYIAIWAALINLRDSYTDQITVQNRDRGAITEESRAINREAALLDGRIAHATLWTPYITDVLGAVPSGIAISRLELIEKPETFIVTGKASQGSDVVTYQAALEKLPWVDRVVAPLQNFARAPEATVTFTIFHRQP